MNLEQFLQKYPNVDVNDFMQAAFNIVNAIEKVSEEITQRDDQDALEDLRRKMDDNSDEEYQQAFDAINWPSDDDNEYDSFDYSADVQYVVASTSYGQNETFFFMGDKNGSHGFSELGCSMAERWGNTFWNMSDAIDEAITNYLDSHDVKLIGTQHIAPDEYCSWVVNKRIYEVTKRQ